MKMNRELDETQCGSLCQHPGCWNSRRRLVRGTPRWSTKLQSFEDNNVENSLPVQTVINLLDEFPEDVDHISSENFAKRHLAANVPSTKMGRKLLPLLEEPRTNNKGHERFMYNPNVESMACNENKHYVWIPRRRHEKRPKKRDESENGLSLKSSGNHTQHFPVSFEAAQSKSSEKKKSRKVTATVLNDISKDCHASSEPQRRTVDIALYFINCEQTLFNEYAPRTSVWKETRDSRVLPDGKVFDQSPPELVHPIAMEACNFAQSGNRRFEKADREEEKTETSIPLVSLGLPELSGPGGKVTASIFKRSEPVNFTLEPVFSCDSDKDQRIDKPNTPAKNEQDTLGRNRREMTKSDKMGGEERNDSSRVIVSDSKSGVISPEPPRPNANKNLPEQDNAVEDQQIMVVGQAQTPKMKPDLKWLKSKMGASTNKTAVNTGATDTTSDAATNTSVENVRHGTSELTARTSVAPRAISRTEDSTLPPVTDDEKEQSSVSPAPPPPSPEPPRLIVPKLHTLHPPASPSPHLKVLIEAAESDSEITISAPPPSNLDDISRINTPSSLASAPRGAIPRESVNLTAARRVHTVPEISVAEEPSWRSTNPSDRYHFKHGKHTTDTNQGNKQFNQFDLSTVQSGNSLSGGLPPHIDADQLSCVSATGVFAGDEYNGPVENGRVVYLKRSDSTQSSTCETEPQNELENREKNIADANNDESNGVPPYVDEEQLQSEDICATAQSHLTYKPLHAVTNVDTINTAEFVEKDTVDSLENFDVTEEDLQNELKGEIEKLN